MYICSEFICNLIQPEKTRVWSVERNGGGEVERPHFAKPQPRTTLISLVDTNVYLFRMHLENG